MSEKTHDATEQVTLQPSTRGKETYLLVGGGIAALAAAEEIRRINPHAAIVMVSEEPTLPYDRTALSKTLFLPRIGERLALRSPTWYSHHGVFLLSGRRVARLLPRAKQVELSDGTVLDYDKCILATGASSILPTVEGRTLDGVFTLRSLNDFESIANTVRPDRRAVVIGGGMLGLEAAWQLYLTGCHVTVLEASDRLLGGRMDAERSEEMIRVAAERGVDVRVGVPVSRLEGSTDSRVEQVILPGEYLNADLVLFCCGSRPRIELAREAGLETDRGISVNARMMTDKYSIYACGDCAQFGRHVCHDRQTAETMGRCAGRNAAGEDTLYSPIVTQMSIEAFGEVFEMDVARQPLETPIGRF